MSSFSVVFQLVVLFWAGTILVDLIRSYRERKVSFFFLLVFGGAAGLGVVFVFVFMPGASDALFSITGISSGANGSFFVAISALMIIARRQHQTIQMLKASQTEIIRSFAIKNINN